MLEPVVSFFEKLIENFSWRRLVFLFVIVLLFGISLWAYESYTSAYRLTRIEKQADLIERIADLNSSTKVIAQADLRQASLNLQRQLLNTTQADSAEYELLPWGKKILAASVAWLVFALCLLLVPGTSGAASIAQMLVGVFVLAAPFILLAAALPTFEAAWINYFAYPLGHIVLLAVFILWIQKWMRKRRAALVPRSTSSV